MTFSTVIVAATAILVLINLVQTLMILKHLTGKTETQRNEELAQAAMDAAAKAPEATAKEPDADRKDPFDEGFENIMRFTVNGKTGFENIGR